MPTNLSVSVEHPRSAPFDEVDDDAKVFLPDGVPQRGPALTVGRVNVQRALQQNDFTSALIRVHSYVDSQLYE